jgi:hypothetical protein
MCLQQQQLQLLLLHVCLQQRCCRCSTHAYYSTQQQQVHAVLHTSCLSQQLQLLLPHLCCQHQQQLPLLPCPELAE